MKLDEQEQAVMDHILAAMQGIQDMGLRVNHQELTIYVHGMQSFPVQRMLQREDPGAWGSWFDIPEVAE